jgi:undecaprenyl diphosphate synthase
MDGNGRWAKKRFMPRTAGHKVGVTATKQLVENCANRDIEVLTIFAFSSENWSRPVQEVDSLMSLFVTTLAGEIKKLHKKNVRVRFIGDRNRFSEKLQKGIADAEQLTQDNTGLKFNIAANYGGRWDIVNATQKLLATATADTNITEQDIAAHLQLADVPDVDLFIRTGGEQRISNFLIWQSAYAELYFTDTLWPDFDESALQQALDWYAMRERRFGKTSKQIESSRSQSSDAKQA